MIKKGFTMAEVLLTMGILGIVATMTLPALMANFQKEQTATSLVKAIAAMENANSIMITQHDMYGIRENCLGLGGEQTLSEATKNYLTACFEPYVMEKLGATKLDKSVTYRGPKDDDTDVTVGAAEGDYDNVYQGNNGIAYIFPGNDDEGKYIRLWIDTNGVEKKPNQKAKDLFEVLMDIDGDGKILPVGGKQWKIATSATDSWEDAKCDKTNDFTTMDWTYCSGSIIDNSGKVIYKWR